MCQSLNLRQEEDHFSNTDGQQGMKSTGLRRLRSVGKCFIPVQSALVCFNGKIIFSSVDALYLIMEKSKSIFSECQLLPSSVSPPAEPSFVINHFSVA